MKNTDVANGNIYVTNMDAARRIIGIILNFLSLFMPVTLAKRVVSIILIAAGTPIPCVAELADLTDRSVKSLGRTMRDGDTSSLLELKEGRGRKRKTIGMEGKILAELEKENYISLDPSTARHAGLP